MSTANPAPKKIFKQTCCALTLLSLLVPNFISTPVGIQLLCNSICITALGSILAIKLVVETKDNNKLCKRVDAAEDDDDELIDTKEALKFPIVASISLFGLYMLINMVNKELISGLQNLYICCSSTYVIGTFLTEFYKTSGLVSDVFIKKLDYNFWYVLGYYHINYDVTKNLIAGFSTGFAINALYLFNKFWVCNNIIGISLSVGAITLLKIKDFKTGLIILWGLFLYDIFWVFHTDVMVTVAKNLNSPIKLQFPLSPELVKFSILGLGDMIIPGIYVAQCLKYDVDMFIKNNKPKNQSGFSSTYFNLAILGYALSIATTYIFMVWFNHAQPALLYIVPFLTVFSLVPALLSGNFREFWSYDSNACFEEEKAKLEEKSKNECTPQVANDKPKAD